MEETGKDGGGGEGTKVDLERQEASTMGLQEKRSFECKKHI